MIFLLNLLIFMTVSRFIESLSIVINYLIKRIATASIVEYLLCIMGQVLYIH